jgi:hypothetical protein
LAAIRAKNIELETACEKLTVQLTASEEGRKEDETKRQEALAKNAQEMEATAKSAQEKIDSLRKEVCNADGK